MGGGGSSNTLRSETGQCTEKKGKAFFREQEAVCFSSHHPVPRAMTKGWRQLALVSLSPRSARCLPVAII